MSEHLEQTILKEQAGQRFDETAALVFDMTKSKAQKLIKSGRLQLNSKEKLPKTIVKEGDTISQIIPEKEGIKDVPILYEDRYLIVINKPAGITVHPAEGEEGITVTEILKKKKGREPFIVHRLDKGTSGVMILAKNKKAQEFLQNEFKNRQVKKSYLALVEGHVEPEKGIVDIPLAREEIVRNKIGPSSVGRSALTEYEVIEYLKKYSYIEANPKTGRTHQIRAHFSAIGYPIVGDERYGSGSNLVPRIFLHAFSISFIHPKTELRMNITCPLPADLDRVILSLKK